MSKNCRMHLSMEIGHVSVPMQWRGHNRTDTFADFDLDTCKMLMNIFVSKVPSLEFFPDSRLGHGSKWYNRI